MICVWVAVMWVVLGEGLVCVLCQGVGCCYGNVCCESGFFMYMTGSGICILC